MKKIIYTIGYTLFQNGFEIDVEEMLQTLGKYGVNFLIDVRSVPFSKQYPQCNADNMRIVGRNIGIQYMTMPEIGAKSMNHQSVFSKASDIFFEKEVFPIAKSYRPEKTALRVFDEIVDFNKMRSNESFIQGLKRIEDAYSKDFTLCLMCSEKKPMECHRYFLISKALEQRYGNWLEVRHIVKDENDSIAYITNKELDKQLEKFICEKKGILSPMFRSDILYRYFGDNEEDRLHDFCDRYWNLLHGWKK